MESSWKKAVLFGVVNPVLFLLTLLILAIPGLMDWLDTGANYFIVIAFIIFYCLIFLAFLILPAVYFGMKLRWYWGVIYILVFIIVIAIMVWIYFILYPPILVYQLNNQLF